MNRFEYAEASTRRSAVDPEYQRPIDPATPRAYDDGTRADRVIREAEASRMYPRVEGEHAYSLAGFSGLDTAAYLVAAIMTLGPLLTGYLTNMQS